MARKQVILLAAALAATGCGSSRHAASFVPLRGNGYRFEAPAGWSVRRTAHAVAATAGDRLVSVTVFPLARPFRSALLPKVRRELGRVASELASQEHGRVVRSAAAPDGGRYVIALDGGKRVQEIAFRLRGRREYQLLCTRRSGDDRSACRRLFVSFAPA